MDKMTKQIWDESLSFAEYRTRMDQLDGNPPKVTLVTVHNAFDRSGRDTRSIESGLTLEEIKAKHLPAAVDFAISINGHVCTDLARVPRPGDLVTAIPVVTGGGNDGKMIGRLIAMIVVAVVASYAAPALAGLFGGTSAIAIGIAQGAIMMVGGLLVNMAFSASQPNNLPAFGTNTAESPAYGWSPQSTQQQGIVLPRWYGRNKLYGNVVVAHISYIGNDSYVNALVHMGFGPFKGLSDFMVNDQPVKNFTGIDTPEIRLGYLDQPVQSMFVDSPVEYQIGRVVKNGVPVTYTTAGNSFDALEVILRLPYGLGYYNEQGAIVSREVQYRVSYKLEADVDWQIATLKPYQYMVSAWGYWSRGYYTYEGPGQYISVWHELSQGSHDVTEHVNGEWIYPITYLNERWLWIDEPANFGTHFYDYHAVWGNQRTPITISLPINIPYQGTYEIKVERVSSDLTAEREFGELQLYGVKEISSQPFTYPRQVLVGLKAMATGQLNGALRFSCIGECAMVRVWDGAEWAVRYSTNPAWVCYDVLTQPVLNATPLSWDFETDQGGWTGTMCTLSVASDNLVITPTGAYPEIVKTDLSFEGSSRYLVSVRIKRTSGTGVIGNIKLSFTTTTEAIGYKLVPNTTVSGSYVTLLFDMRTLDSGGNSWVNGTITGMTLSLSDHTHLLDFVTVANEVGSDVIRYDGIDPSRIDHIKFLDWANYCDELLPDGSGGEEKRVEFNGGFDSEMTLWEAVLRICSVAYAVPVWNGINLSVSIDRPTDPVQLFSLGNIDQDSFKESFLPIQDRAAEIEVDFVNEENGYQRDKLTVINTAVTTVNSKVSMSLFGITKPSMAWRAAMRKLAYNQHISRTIEFGADIDAIACTIGDVVLIQHDVPQWGYGGRVVSATTSEITIDQTITLAPDTQYAILVRMGDDSLVERDITNVPGDASVLTVSPAFASAPQQFDVYSVGEILKTAKPFRVSDIARDGDLKAKISAVEYVPAVYDVDYDIPATPVINYTQALTNYKQALPPFENIVSVSVSETLIKSASGQVSVVATIQWTPPVNRYAFPAAEVWAWQDNTPPVKISGTAIKPDSFEWVVPADGVYWNFAVGCVNLNGESQSVVKLTPARKFIFGKTSAPSSITDFNFTQVITGGLRFSWSAVADLDVFEYIIRYSPLTTGASWDGATEIIRTAASYANLSIAQTGTYLIKAVDTTGHHSAIADTVIISNVPSIVGLTHHSLIDEAPVWGGFLTNMIVSSGKLQPAWTSGMPESGIIPPFVGRYTFGSEVDFGEPKSARVSAAMEWTATPAPLDTIANLDEWMNIDGASGKSWAKVYIKTSQDSSNPTFKQPLFSGDFVFQRASFEIEIYAYGSDLVYGVACPINIDLHDTSLTI